jgi:hypothetical protein
MRVVVVRYGSCKILEGANREPVIHYTCTAVGAWLNGYGTRYYCTVCIRIQVYYCTAVLCTVYSNNNTIGNFLQYRHSAQYRLPVYGIIRALY